MIIINIINGGMLFHQVLNFDIHFDIVPSYPPGLGPNHNLGAGFFIHQ